MYLNSCIRKWSVFAGCIASVVIFSGCSEEEETEVTFSDTEYEYVNLVGSLIAEGNETEVNEWYNTTHIPIVWTYTDLQKAFRFQALETPADPLPQYWAAYYYTTAEAMNGMAPGLLAFDSAMAEMATHWPNNEITSTVICAYQKIKSFEKGNKDIATEYFNIVGAEFAAASEAAINSWYNDTHIPMLMEYDGLVKAIRFKKIGGPANADTMPSYLAIYYYSSQQAMNDNVTHTSFASAMADAQQKWGDNLQTKLLMPSKRLFVKTR